ncbi:hypothetical protein GCM10020295_70800 [Streptomyces cinereospinus]
MSAEQAFGHPQNYRTTRAEYLGAFAVAAVAFLWHVDEVRWGPAILLFAYIDIIGYIPGLIAYHLSEDGRIHPVFHILYNVMHTWLSAGAVILLWVWLVGPEWALLVVPPAPVRRPRSAGQLRQAGRRAVRALRDRPPEGLPRRTAGTGAVHMTAARPDVLENISTYADHPSGFLAYNDDVEHFTSASVPGVISYRRRGSTVFVFGGPFAPAEHRAALLAEFQERVAGRRQRLVAVQVRAGDLDVFAAATGRSTSWAARTAST